MSPCYPETLLSISPCVKSCSGASQDRACLVQAIPPTGSSESSERNIEAGICTFGKACSSQQGGKGSHHLTNDQHCPELIGFASSISQHCPCSHPSLQLLCEQTAITQRAPPHCGQKTEREPLRARGWKSMGSFLPSLCPCLL